MQVLIAVCIEVQIKEIVWILINNEIAANAIAIQKK